MQLYCATAQSKFDLPTAAPSLQSSPTDSTESPSSWSMELTRWRLRLRRLKRWSRNEGRASDGQLSVQAEIATSSPEPHRHSISSVETYERELVVPPVCIPHEYRQKDRQRGIRVGGDRIPFTFDGHKHRRKMMRGLMPIVETEPLTADQVPDMRLSMASIYTYKGRRRRAVSM